MKNVGILFIWFCKSYKKRGESEWVSKKEKEGERVRIREREREEYFLDDETLGERERERGKFSFPKREMSDKNNSQWWDEK